jgi:hypothetical protein
MSVIDCPHCGLRIMPKGKQCPACRNDVTDLRDAAKNLEGARLRELIGQLIAAGKSRDVIRRFLIEEQGLFPEQVDEALARAAAHYQSAGEVRGPRDIVVGLLWFAGGAGVTITTFQVASVKGGHFVLAYGPVIFGAWRLLIGVERFFRSRRRI